MAPEDSDPLRQAEAAALGRARRRLGLADSAVSLAVLVALAALAGRLGAWSLAALAAVPPLASLPFAVVGYRLSRRFGLSRQSPRGWLADRAKALGVALALGGGVALAVVLLQRAAPDWWPLFAWLGGVGLSALLAVAFPVLLLPLFVRSQPLPEGALRDALVATAKESGVPVGELRLLRLGEKTAAANAMVAGLGPTRRIYVSDTLVEDAEDAVERARVILAHELGHHVHRDLWRGLAASALSLAAGVAGAWAGVASLAPAGGGHLSALPAAALGLALGSAVAGPAGAWYSRRRERAADAFAVAVTGQGEAYARAMERLVARNLSELWPPRLRHALTASHPMPGDRIRAARRGLPDASTG